MTAPEETTAEATTPAPTKRSPGVVAAIVIVIVIALVGGGLLVYKLTKSKDTPDTAVVVAHKVTAAIGSGNTATLRSLSTGEGTTQLLVLKPNSASGIKFVARDCKPFPAKLPTRVCTATRPGGQLSIRLIFTSGAWKVDQVNVGAAGLPPTSTTT
jgi:hypothetical protein